MRCSASRSGATRSPTSDSPGRIRCTTGCGPTGRSPTAARTGSGSCSATTKSRRCCGRRTPRRHRSANCCCRRRATASCPRRRGRTSPDWLLINDAPDHTRLRAAVSRAFTPRQIDRYEPLVRQAVGELVDELDTTREIDIVEAFTTRLPIQAIAAILGLPLDRRPWLLDASREIGGMLEPLTPFDPDSMSERFAELDSYFRTVIAERRDQPGHDLISALAATDDGHALDDEEIVAMIAFLLFAGHETVTGTARQRPRRAGPAPGPTHAPPRQPRSDRERRRGAAALRSAGTGHRPAGHRRPRRRRRHDPARRQHRAHDRRRQP